MKGFERLLRRIPAAVGFGLAGALAFLADLAAFNGLLFGGADPEVSNVVAYLTAIVVNYLVNRTVFADSRRVVTQTIRSVWRFLLVAGMSFAYVVAMFNWASSFLDEPTVFETNAVRVLIIGSVTVVRFFVLRNWVFSSYPTPSKTEESRR